MGLALYNSPSHPPSFPPGEDEEDGDLQGLGLCQHRYLPGHAGPSFIDPTNPKARHARKPFKWSSEKFTNLHLCALQLDNGSEQTGDALPEDWLPHHVLAARSTPVFQRKYDYFFGPTPRDIDHSRGKANQSKKLHFEDECQEARALARDGRVRLPYDGERQRSSQRRPPSLERQDAFRDGRTAKRKRLLDEGDAVSDEELRLLGLLYDDDNHHNGDAQQDKELYAMGLLYDNEHLRGERFSLQQIQREEPVYAIKARHKKDRRRRKSQKLDMTLEFSVLGEDEEIAALLTAGGNAEVARCTEEASKAAQQQHSSPALTVIYELVEERNGEEEEKEEEEETWDIIIDGEECNEDGNATPAMADVMVEMDSGSGSGEGGGGGTTEPWVVLGP